MGIGTKEKIDQRQIEMFTRMELANINRLREKISPELAIEVAVENLMKNLMLILSGDERFTPIAIATAKALLDHLRENATADQLTYLKGIDEALKFFGGGRNLLETE